MTKDLLTTGTSRSSSSNPLSATWEQSATPRPWGNIPFFLSVLKNVDESRRKRVLICGLDPNRPIVDIATPAAVRSASISPQRLNATAVGAFAHVALLLTLVAFLASAFPAWRASEINLREE